MAISGQAFVIFLVYFLAIALNGLFLMSLLYKKKLGVAYTRGDIFLANISFVDLMGGMRLTYQWMFVTGVAGPVTCDFDVYFPRCVVGVQICLLAGLALERYFGVVKLKKLEKKWMILVLAICWAFGIGITGTLTVALAPYGFTTMGCSTNFTAARWAAFVLAFQVLFIWGIFVVVYYRVWKVSSDSMSAVNDSTEVEKKLALRLFLIVFLFSVCWTPEMCALFFTAITNQTQPAWLATIGAIGVAINLVVDPALFLWVSPDNRNALKACLTCAVPVKQTKRNFELSTTKSSRPSRGDGLEGSRSRSSQSRPYSPALSLNTDSSGHGAAALPVERAPSDNSEHAVIELAVLEDNSSHGSHGVDSHENKPERQGEHHEQQAESSTASEVSSSSPASEVSSSSPASESAASSSTDFPSTSSSAVGVCVE